MRKKPPVYRGFTGPVTGSHYHRTDKYRGLPQKLIRYSQHGHYKKQQKSNERSAQVNDVRESQPLITRSAQEQECHEIFLRNRSQEEPIIFNRRDLVRDILVGLISIFILSVIFIVITSRYYTLFKINSANGEKLAISINTTIRLVQTCHFIIDHHRENLAFFPVALALIFSFSWCIKRQRSCLKTCDGRPGLLSPIAPFSIENRITSATVFGIIVYQLLKIFEGLLFDLEHNFDNGVLMELLQRCALIFMIGVRYYPVLASLQLRNIVARFLVCLYILCDIIYTIVREGSCMGFLPLGGQYAVIEEAKLRTELGTWFIIYGIIKNTPHFLFLSYIGAELCVRFAYDSIYVPGKKKECIGSPSSEKSDELQFAKYYVRKLLSRNRRSLSQTKPEQTKNINRLDSLKSTIGKYLDSIYHWDDDFRFTTIATCTYTVAFTFLYYLTCTFIFVYTSRSTGHIESMRSYIERSVNVELKNPFSLNREIIISTIITAILFALQLFVGMKNYKRHKQQLYRGVSIEIPPANRFKCASIVSDSVHYSGFLVGYMTWGFVICFHLVLFVATGVRLMALHTPDTELILPIIVPLAVMYLLKILFMTSTGKILFIGNGHKTYYLKNIRAYAIFVYFSFFADSFAGIASCITRLLKATVINAIFIARIDYCFTGHPFVNLDTGFSTYASYLHVEKQHTHPVLLVFCDLLWKSIKKSSTENTKSRNLLTVPDSEIRTVQRSPISDAEIESNKKDDSSTVQKQILLPLTSEIISENQDDKRPQQIVVATENKRQSLKIIKKKSQQNKINGHNNNDSSTQARIYKNKELTTNNGRKGTDKTSNNNKMIILHNEIGDKHRYETIAMEEHEDNTTAARLPTDSRTSRNSSQKYFRTISYKKALDVSSPIGTEGSQDSSPACNHSTSPLLETINTEHLTSEAEKERKKRKNLARNRWRLAYTVICNYHLIHLKKKLTIPDIPKPSQPNTPIDEQLSRPLSESLDTENINAGEHPPSPAETYILFCLPNLLINQSQPSNSTTSTPLSLKEIIDPFLFRAVSSSDVSTDEDPPTNGTVGNILKLRKPLTHAEHMQACIFTQSTTCALSNNLQNLEYDDVISLWDKFPSIIDKIKETVNRFRCPKGWKRLGGSCYYLPDLTALPTTANGTCNYLHSNLSNIIQVRNAVELFYVAHVLTRNDLSALMVSVDTSLFKGKNIAETLMNDQGRWERMKSRFYEVRVKYRALKQKIVNRLSSTGLRILTRSKKIKPLPTKPIHDENNLKQYDQQTNSSFSNHTIIPTDLIIINDEGGDDDEYEYDDLDSLDESDEFEQIQDIRGICDQIAWNALDDNSTTFILTTYIVSDKIICSLSDVEPDHEYPILCEY
ncbi:unnamed protein product, partial [Rotaria socialis]